MAITKLKLKDGRTRYRVRYRVPGVKNPKTETFDTKQQAEDFEARLRLAKSGGTQVKKASNLSLEAFGIIYLERYAIPELSPATRKTNRSHWNKWVLPKLGGHSLASLAADPELVQGFKADLVAEGCGDAVTRRTLVVLSGVLTKAVEWGYIASNPVSAVRKPSGKRKRKVRAMPPELVERLRSLMPSERDKRLISVLAYSGLRPGEALALTGVDVALKTVTVDKAISLGEEKDTKTHVERLVPLLSPLRDDLTPRDTGLLFPRQDGQPWRDHDYRNWRKRVFKPAVEKLGEEWAGFRPYDLRHSFASLLLAEGRNPLELAEYMGNSPTILLSTYAHVIGELRGSKPVPAEKRIRDARAKLRVKNVSKRQAA